MNYRHAFHAGGFVDVVKHAILARLVEYLKLKPAAFRVIDTHAGIGSYDLTGDEAQRSPEWQDGHRAAARARPAARRGGAGGPLPRRRAGKILAACW